MLTLAGIALVVVAAYALMLVALRLATKGEGVL